MKHSKRKQGLRRKGEREKADGRKGKKGEKPEKGRKINSHNGEVKLELD